MHGTCGFYHFHWYSLTCGFAFLRVIEYSLCLVTDLQEISPHLTNRHAIVHAAWTKDCLKHDSYCMLFSLSFKYIILQKLGLNKLLQEQIRYLQIANNTTRKQNQNSFFENSRKHFLLYACSNIVFKTRYSMKWRYTDKSNTATLKPHDIARFHEIFH